MCLVQWWAYTDFGQSCCLLSWNWPLMNYFCGQSHQAWPQIPNTQGVSCGPIGVGDQSVQGQKSQVEDSVWLDGNAEVCLTQGQWPLPQFYLYSCAVMRSPGLRPVQSPFQRRNWAWRHTSNYYRRLAVKVWSLANLKIHLNHSTNIYWETLLGQSGK